MKTIGIIAGNGRFPLLAAREASRQGYKIVVCGIEKEADASLEKYADRFYWVKVGQLKKLVNYFKKENVQDVMMAGKIEKVRLFQENVKPDFEMVKVLMKTKDFKDDSLLSGICDYLESQKIHILDSTFLMGSLMPGEGVLGKKRPSKEVIEDIRFGFDLCKSIAGLDVGQTVVVKKKAPLAIEAIEGTDKAIRRGGLLGDGKVTVIKVAKPNQDMRFDVPAVGLRTMEELIQAKAKAFAFEAEKTILIDKEEFIEMANRHGIALVGVVEKIENGN